MQENVKLSVVYVLLEMKSEVLQSSLEGYWMKKSDKRELGMTPAVKKNKQTKNN